jgi:hypothetical protein
VQKRQDVTEIKHETVSIATCGNGRIRTCRCNRQHDRMQRTALQTCSRQHAMLQHVTSTCNMQRCFKLQHATRTTDRMQQTSCTTNSIATATRNRMQRTALQRAQQLSCNRPLATRNVNMQRTAVVPWYRPREPHARACAVLRHETARVVIP